MGATAFCGDPAGVDGLELEVRHRNETVVVLVRGEIDLATAPELARALDDFGEEQSVIVDIAEVSSLDARGIAVVVDHDRRLRRAGTASCCAGRRRWCGGCWRSRATPA